MVKKVNKMFKGSESLEELILLTPIFQRLILIEMLDIQLEHKPGRSLCRMKVGDRFKSLMYDLQHRNRRLLTPIKGTQSFKITIPQLPAIKG